MQMLNYQGAVPVWTCVYWHYNTCAIRRHECTFSWPCICLYNANTVVVHVYFVDVYTQFGYFARRCIVHVHITWCAALALQKRIDTTMRYCKVTVQVMRCFFCFLREKGGLRRPWRLSTSHPKGVPGLLEPPRESSLEKRFFFTLAEISQDIR